jgi:hypothetical protein
VCFAASVFAACQSQATTPEPVSPPPAPPPGPAATAAETPQPESAAPQKQAETAPPPIVVKDVGFKTPESVLYDPEADVYLVSNVNGSPFEQDDNGFISKVGPAGNVIELKWIDGAKADVALNAPKGMALSGNVLYVADITWVRLFDRKTGKPKGKLGVPGSTFLNGMATAKDGTVYLSDSGLKPGKEGFAPSGSDAVYKIGKRMQAERVLKDKDLKGPNGVAAADKGVWVASFGGKEIFRIGPDKKKQDVTEVPKGQLDGLVRLPDGTLLVSSWEASTIFAKRPGAKFEPVITDVKSPADIGYDTKRNRVLVPLFQADRVQIHPLAFEPAQAPAPAESPKAAPATAPKAAEGAAKDPASPAKPAGQ